MTWPTGQLPAEVTALRDMLASCNSWTSNGGAQGQVHYPDFYEATDTIYPAALIISTSFDPVPYAAGSGALPNGEMRIEVYVQDTVSAADAIGRGIAAELAGATTGLPIRSARAGEAQDISPGRQASIDDSTTLSYRAIPIYLTYGLSV